MFTIAICATPKRIDNLLAVIDSIIASGFQKDNIHVFMEPIWDNKDIIDKISNTGVVLHENEEQLWCFMNHANALEWLTDNAKTKYVILTQEDFVFVYNAKKQIEEALDSLQYTQWFGFLNLYTSPKKKDFLWKRWWQEINFGYWTYWTCFVMEHSMIKKLIIHPFYINHALTYKANQQVDSTIWYIMKRFNKPTYYHNPSLVKHIWDSLIWHYDPEQGQYTFVDKPHIIGVVNGEQYDYDNMDKNRTIWLCNLFGQVDCLISKYDSLSWECGIDDVFVNVSDKIVYPNKYITTSLDYMRKYSSNISYWQTYTTEDGKSITFDINDYIPEPLYYLVKYKTVDKNTLFSSGRYSKYMCVPHNADTFRII